MKYFNKLLLAVALLVSIAVQAQDRYLDPVFNEVTVTRDLTYGVNSTVLYATVVGQAIPEEL
ncbi:MAG: hypothetical protein KAX50_07335, partial [Saprospiraceae bacterium]|nr:hypothetical protein [Saprospiraceae bacterium]